LRQFVTTPNSTVAPPRWERRKDARPAELIAAALHLFIEKGYAGTRLADVASRAGVSKGTLYLYFENKEELFKAVVRDNVVARISKSAEELLRFGGSSAELLSSLITRWWRDYGSSGAGGLGKLIMAESGNFPEIARFFLDEVIEPWHALLAGTLTRGVERGEFRAVNVPMFVRVITAPLVMLSLWTRSFGPCSGQPVDADAYIATHVDMVLVALRRT
jgi:AcrR family transcriptional regulator